MTVCVKQLGGRIPVSEIVLVRSVVSIALTGTAMAHGGVSPLGNNRRLLLLRGICGSVALHSPPFSPPRRWSLLPSFPAALG